MFSISVVARCSDGAAFNHALGAAPFNTCCLVDRRDALEAPTWASGPSGKLVPHEGLIAGYWL